MDLEARRLESDDHDARELTEAQLRVARRKAEQWEDLLYGAENALELAEGLGTGDDAGNTRRAIEEITHDIRRVVRKLSGISQTGLMEQGEEDLLW